MKRRFLEIKNKQWVDESVKGCQLTVQTKPFNIELITKETSKTVRHIER